MNSEAYQDSQRVGTATTKYRRKVGVADHLLGQEENMTCTYVVSGESRILRNMRLHPSEKLSQQTSNPDAFKLNFMPVIVSG